MIQGMDEARLIFWCKPAGLFNGRQDRPQDINGSHIQFLGLAGDFGPDFRRYDGIADNRIGFLCFLDNLINLFNAVDIGHTDDIKLFLHKLARCSTDNRFTGLPNGVGNGIDDGLISYDRSLPFLRQVLPEVSSYWSWRRVRRVSICPFFVKRKNYGQAVHFPFDKTSSRRSSWFMGLRKDNLG